MKLASVESPAHAVESTSTCAARARHARAAEGQLRTAAKREQDVLFCSAFVNLVGREERRPVADVGRWRRTKTNQDSLCLVVTV